MSVAFAVVVVARVAAAEATLADAEEELAVGAGKLHC